MVLAGVPAGVPAGVRETPHSMPPAAIIAAGGVPFDMGTDTGGSIRLPSHCCGTAGLKPTAGRVPRTGHIIAYDIGHMDLLTHAGPMARYVEDLGLLLPIIAGPDWRDPVIVPAPLGEAADVALPSLRMAFYWRQRHRHAHAGDCAGRRTSCAGVGRPRRRHHGGSAAKDGRVRWAAGASVAG